MINIDLESLLILSFDASEIGNLYLILPTAVSSYKANPASKNERIAACRGQIPP